MKATSLLLVMIIVLGCEAFATPVRLLTGNPVAGAGCFTSSAAGPLVADARYGTAIIDTDNHMTTTVPVAWRPGFAGRRVGSDVQVLDPNGNVVATTGRSYRIAGGYATVAGIETFWACDWVKPLPSSFPTRESSPSLNSGDDESTTRLASVQESHLAVADPSRSWAAHSS